MTLHNICTKKVYEKDGIQKTQWFKVGLLKEADSGKRYLKLFMHPDTEFFVFDKDREDEVPQMEQSH